MEGDTDKLLNARTEARRSKPVSWFIFESVRAMTEDEITLLYENGVEFILWLREKNPSLLKTFAADTRERWNVKMAGLG